MTNADVARAFFEIADLLDIRGEDGFRVTSYRRVARTIAELHADINEVVARGELHTIEGVGKSSAEKIEEYLKTGRLSVRDELIAEVPETLLALLDVPLLGPRKVALLWKERNVTSLPELREAIELHRLDDLKGFGDKTLQRMLIGIDFIERSAKQVRLGDAWQIATKIGNALLKVPGVKRIVRAGALRRGCEMIGDIDLLCISEDPMPVIRRFLELSGVKAVVSADGKKASVRFEFRGGQTLPTHLRVVPEQCFGAAWLYWTGSDAHYGRLREMAKARGYVLNDHGLFARERTIACRTEEEIYEALVLPWVPPEMRENKDEFGTYEIPEDIVSVEMIRGDLHMHTTASDGRNTVEEMATAARHRGYEFICITEHSQSSNIAGGLKIERLLEHVANIRALNKRIDGITILAGAEVDILANGRLDYPDQVLAQLDFVMASIHSGLGHDTKTNTARTLAAIRNPFVNCISHPTGRLIKERVAMPLDIETICKEAARTGTALEINANYHRLDLKDDHARLAREHTVTLCINTDAHSVEQLDQMHFGVLTARRAGLREHDVLNTRSAGEIAFFVGVKRERARSTMRL